MTEKSTTKPDSPATKSWKPSAAVTFWAAMAGLSLAYLGLLVTQPTLVAQYLGGGSTVSDAQIQETRKAVAQATSEVETLRGTIDLFRNELIEIRAQLSGQSDATRDIQSRLAAIEPIVADSQRVASKDAAKGKKTKGAEKTETALAAPAQSAAKTPAAKNTPVETATGQATSPVLETGSVAGPSTGAITFGPPEITPAAVAPQASKGGGGVGVQIATGPSVDSLRLSWTLLAERHGDSLRGLEPRYVTGPPGPGQTYDLIAGPLASAEEARKLCQDLAQKATPCIVSRFTGDAL
jgi:hypothetical protein